MEIRLGNCSSVSTVKALGRGVGVGWGVPGEALSELDEAMHFSLYETFPVLKMRLPVHRNPLLHKSLKIITTILLGYGSFKKKI